MFWVGGASMCEEQNYIQKHSKTVFKNKKNSIESGGVWSLNRGGGGEGSLLPLGGVYKYP